MSKTKSKPLFTIRRIANRNPRLPRIYHAGQQKIWRLAVVLILAIAGVASLFFFKEEIIQPKLETQLFKADSSALLGSGFETITGFAGTAVNPGVSAKGLNFSSGGVGMINAVLYNVKDYFKYIAGSIAILYLIISALQIIISMKKEGIDKGKKNLFWSVFALVIIFVIDSMVTTFFEGGGGSPGQSLFSVSSLGIPTEQLGLFQNIAYYFQINARVIFGYLQTLAGAFAILFIFLAGAQMVMAGGSDEKIEKEKKYLMHAITAFITLLMLEPIIFGFIYPNSNSGLSDPRCVEFMQAVAHDGYLNTAPAGCRSATELGLSGSNQILGVVHFFESLVGGIAVFFIVYSGVTIIASMGNEETVKKERKNLAWSAGGLGVILLANTLINKFFFVVNPATGDAHTDVVTGIDIVTGVTNFLAGFIGVFAVVTLIITGVVWVGNFGNDEIAKKSQKAILGAIIGIVLSISAYAIVNTLTRANSGNLASVATYSNIELASSQAALFDWKA